MMQDSYPSLDPGRLQECDALLQRLGSDRAHSKRVYQHAAILWQWLYQEQLLVKESHTLLEAVLLACQLHDTGQVIADDDHHRHSRYIVLHAQETAAWTESLRQDVGSLVVTHRKRAKKKWYSTYLQKNPGLLQMATILRIADGLDRTRDPLVQLSSAKRSHDSFTLTVQGLYRQDEERILKRKADLWPFAFPGYSLILNSRMTQ